MTISCGVHSQGQQRSDSPTVAVGGVQKHPRWEYLPVIYFKCKLWVLRVEEITS
jgi:hypothetical protein